MSVFVDTSAFVAMLDRDDEFHDSARKAFEGLGEGDEVLVCSNYVLLETHAVLQHRLGIKAVRTFHEDFVPLLEVEWVDAPTHEAGVAVVLGASRKRLGLVDCVSFQVMRRLGIKTAFTFDSHFKEQGFRCLPG